MGRTEDILKKLPKEIQDLIRPYIPLLEEMTVTEIGDWIVMMVDESWRVGYAALVKRMGVDGQVNEVKRLNSVLRAFNKENAGLVYAQKQIIHHLVKIALEIIFSV